MPTAVAPGWVPYSTGRWIWDPRFGWTWLDDAPWGWAPYHHGRWVYVNSYWAWAPGPIVVRPAYAPALVVFLGGVTVSVGRPVFWAPLCWGEPVIPWWGRPGFIGVASWRGWGGPRVVNNVVINRSTTVNVTNINVYRNVNVTNAVVGVPSDRFGRGHVQVQRVNNAQARELRPVRGELEVKPVAASVAPATGSAARPPAAVETRRVVATRAPRDVTPALQSQGLPTASPAAAPAPAPRIVPSPRQSARRDPAVETRGNQNVPPTQPRVVTPPPPGGMPAQPGVTAPAKQPRVVTPDATPRGEGNPRADSPTRERRQGGESGRSVTPPPAPATPGGAPAPAPPAAPAPKVMNAPPAGAPASNAPAPAAPAPPAPRVINTPPAPPAPSAPAPGAPAPGAGPAQPPRGRDQARPEPRVSAPPPAPSAPAPGAPAPGAGPAQPPRGRDQARPEPSVSAPPRQPTPPATPAPSIQPAPQPGGPQPPAPPRFEQRSDRSERPARIEMPRARIEAPPRQERAPERIQERAPRPEPRIERGVPERGVPDRGGPERERGKPAA